MCVVFVCVLCLYKWETPISSELSSKNLPENRTCSIAEISDAIKLAQETRCSYITFSGASHLRQKTCQSERGLRPITNEKALGETQTLRAGCSKAEPKIFASPQTPFPGTQDGQNLISWRRSLSSPTNQVW